MGSKVEDSSMDASSTRVKVDRNSYRLSRIQHSGGLTNDESRSCFNTAPPLNQLLARVGQGYQLSVHATRQEFWKVEQDREYSELVDLALLGSDLHLDWIHGLIAENVHLPSLALAPSGEILFSRYQQDCLSVPRQLTSGRGAVQIFWWPLEVPVDCIWTGIRHLYNGLRSVV